MPLRALIRSSIAHCCYNAIYGATSNFGGGTPSTNGIAEFLEIFCSIIHGFSIPVKAEHKDFLRNVLVPLHKCRNDNKVKWGFHMWKHTKDPAYIQTVDPLLAGNSTTTS